MYEEKVKIHKLSKILMISRADFLYGTFCLEKATFTIPWFSTTYESWLSFWYPYVVGIEMYR